MITSEEARKRFDGYADRFVARKKYLPFKDGFDYDFIMRYITQQEKVNELLSIYKKLPFIKVIDELSDEDIKILDKLEGELND